MSYNFCESIDGLQNIGVKCDLKKGYESLGWIAKRSDIDYSATVVEGNVVKTIALKEGAKFSYIGQLKNGFQETTVAFAAGTYRNTFTNTVSFVVWQNDADTAANIDTLANGEYVIVLEQKEKSVFTGEEETKVSTYRVFGFDNGCVMSACDNDNFSDDYLAGFKLAFEETAAVHSALYLASDQKTVAKFQEPA